MGDHCLELTAIIVGLCQEIRRRTGRILPPRLSRPKHYSASTTAASAKAIRLRRLLRAAAVGTQYLRYQIRVCSNSASDHAEDRHNGAYGEPVAGWWPNVLRVSSISFGKQPAMTAFMNTPIRRSRSACYTRAANGHAGAAHLAPQRPLCCQITG